MQNSFDLNRTAGDGHQWRGIIMMVHDQSCGPRDPIGKRISHNLKAAWLVLDSRPGPSIIYIELANQCSCHISIGMCFQRSFHHVQPAWSSPDYMQQCLGLRCLILPQIPVQGFKTWPLEMWVVSFSLTTTFSYTACGFKPACLNLLLL